MVLLKTYSFFEKYVISMLHILINLDYLQKNVYVLKRRDVKLSFLPNEAFAFNYNDKSGVELEFRPRKKNNGQE
jgi:hypothetical protein